MTDQEKIELAQEFRAAIDAAVEQAKLEGRWQAESDPPFPLVDRLYERA